MARLPTHEHFPTTHHTWLHERITEGEESHQVLCRELMTRYRVALLVYVRGSTLRVIGEADDIVHGFFEHFFSHPELLARWKTSGIPLRRWMINGLILHARGLRRDASRNREASGLQSVMTRASDEPEAARAFEAAWAKSILSDAATCVEMELLDEGRSNAWEVFARHVIAGEPYAQCCPPLGYTADEGRTVTRMVSTRIRRALQGLLRREGTPDADIAQEQRRLEGLFEG